jgi:tyrosinase
VANPNSNWGQCQHGNWWFFPWHRAYLHYFERIVRVYANDPTLCIPYWDYSNPQARALPAVFREPGSSLYDSSRNLAVNNGTDQLDPAFVVTGTNASMAYTTFADFGEVITFGGRAVNAPTHASQPHGALEAVPHDIVHGFVGGNMGNPDLAARDPVFFSHHANIDRLWVEWLLLGQGRANPSNDVWLNQSFTFYDENKQPVSITMREVLDTTALGYTYDRVGPTPPSTARVAGSTRAETLVRVSTPELKLTSRPVRIALTLPEDSRLKMKLGGLPFALIPSQVHLRLDGVKFAGPADSCVTVYVNLPKEVSQPDPRSPYYAGCFTFFGPGHGGTHTSHVDVTKHLQRLWPYLDRSNREVGVTLVRHSCGTKATGEFPTTCTCSHLSLAACK